MVAKRVVHIYITAELKAYWFLLSSTGAEFVAISPVYVCLLATDRLDNC